VPGIRKAPTRSRLLAKFGKGKALNPFAEEERRCVENMAEGVATILGMHNTAELSALCGTMVLDMQGTNREKKERILKAIAEETVRTRNPEKAYSTVLNMIYEGILFEYLRTQGAPLRSAEHDPRVFCLLFWRNRAAEQYGVTFRPHYMPRLVRPRFVDERLDDDLQALLNGVAAKEVYVKEAEKRVKGNDDYRNVVMYLASVTDMHDFEMDARQYLIGEVSQLRGKAEHINESLELLNAQTVELEGKHHRMAREWCKSVASSEAAVDAYVGIINDSLVSANAMANQIENFLETHGGRAANKLHPTNKSGIDKLVPTLLARFNLDMQTAAQEARNDRDKYEALRLEHEKQSRALASETARASLAEDECAAWARRHEALQRQSAERIAQLELESQWLGSEAASGRVERVVQSKRFDLVRPQLLAMLTSGKADDEQKGAAMLEALGMMDAQGIAQYLEGILMRREDLGRYADLALAAAGNAPAQKVEKAVKKGGGKKKK